MRRLMRSLLVVGGVLLVLWAIRDRFVTVGLPRSEEPMSFRVSPREHAAPPAELTSIPGIGPVYAERLAGAGIANVADLVAADPDDIAAAAQVSVSRATSWLDAAPR